MSTDRAADEVALERVFEDIHATRMADLPFLNPALRVEALGFRDWSGQRLGALVTPWSINLILLHGSGAPLPAVRAGDEHAWAFPSGVYGFQSHEAEGIGHYHQCSLFSPPAEFTCHDDAVAAARAALEALLAPPVPEVEPAPAMRSRRSLFGGA
jgi:[NiFe] hydrogenase assembly HybE family chaperone